MNNHKLFFKKLLTTLIGGGLLCLSILSCNNFLEADKIKEDIYTVIEYNNAPFYTIKVDGMKGAGTVKNPVNGETEKKVTDVFTIKFEPADDHIFLKWEAIIPNLSSNEKVEDYITFEDEKSTETKAIFHKANTQIRIVPVCPAKILVNNFNLNNAEKTYPRDSSIILTFNEELDDDCLENILINIPGIPEGKTFRDYFKPPVKDGKSVIFYANIDWDNVREEDFIPIPVTNDKIITVTLPKSQIHYTCNDYKTPIDVKLDKDLTYTYHINSENSKKTKIQFLLSQENSGTFIVDGQTRSSFTSEYSIGKTINIRYQIDDEYLFTKWYISRDYTNENGLEITDVFAIENDRYYKINLDENNNEIPEFIDKLSDINLSFSYQDHPQSNGYNKNSNLLQANITINNQTEGLVRIEPKIIVAPRSNVKLEGEHGMMIPAKDVSYDTKRGVTNSISFNTETNYSFVKWQAYIAYDDYDKDGKLVHYELEDSSYISFTNIYNSNSSYELIAVPDEDLLNKNFQIIIRPIIAERPQIVSNSPIQNTGTVDLDSSIQVMFDHDMDEKSIYYTKEEVDNLRQLLGIPADQDEVAEDNRQVVSENPDEVIPLDNSSFAQNSNNRQPSYYPWNKLLSTQVNGVKKYYGYEKYTNNDFDNLAWFYYYDWDWTDPSEVTNAKNEFHDCVKNNKAVIANATTFKNVLIQNNSTGNNITGYFQAPKFKNSRTLSIDVISQMAGAVKQVLLPPYTPIIVAIDSNFFYTIDQNAAPVTMGTSKKWIYQVGSTTDVHPPVFAKWDDSTNRIAPRIQLRYKTSGESNQNWHEIPLTDKTTTATEITTTTGEIGGGLDGLNVSRSSEIKLDFKITDTGSGPDNTYTIVATKLYDSLYKPIETPVITSIGKDYTYYSEDEALQTGYCYLNLQSGIYELYLKVRDKSGFETIYPDPTGTDKDKRWRICYDNTGPSYLTNDFSHSPGENYIGTDGKEYATLNLTYNENKYIDFAYLYLPFAKQKQGTSFDSNNHICIAKGEGTGTNNQNHVLKNQQPRDSTYQVRTDDNNQPLPNITLKPGTLYRLDPYFYDYSYNNSNPYYYYQFTNPAAPSKAIINPSTATAVSIRVYRPYDSDGTTPYGNFTGARVRWRKVGESDDSWSAWKNSSKTTTDEVSILVSDLPKGSNIEFEIVSYDNTAYPSNLSVPKRLNLIPATRYGNIPFTKNGNPLSDPNQTYNDTTGYLTYKTQPNDPVLKTVKYGTTSNKIDITYEKPEGEFDYIYVYYSEDPNFQTGLHYFEIPSAQATGSYTLADTVNIKPGTKYYIRLMAKYGTRTSDNSEIMSTYTRPAPVEWFEADDIYSTEIGFEWASPTVGRYDCYEIYCRKAGTSEWILYGEPDDGEYTYWWVGEDYYSENTKIIPGHKYDAKIVTYINEPVYKADGITIDHWDSIASVEESTATGKQNYVTNIQAPPPYIYIKASKNPNSTESDPKINLTWTKPDTSNGERFDGYRIWYTTDGSFDLSNYLKTWNRANAAVVPSGGCITITNTNTTSYTLNKSQHNITQNGFYYIYLETYLNASNNYDYSDQNQNHCLSSWSSTRYCLALEAVKNLKAKPRAGYEESQITLTWECPPSTTYDGLQILSIPRMNYESTGTSLANPSKGTTSYNLQYTYYNQSGSWVGNKTISSANGNVGANKKVIYRVATTKKNGSDSVTIYEDITACTASKPVTGLTSTAQSPTSVKLSWTNPAVGTYEAIKVYRGDTLLTTLTKDATSYTTASNLTGGTNYTFYVKTTNKNGDERSVSTSVTTPPNKVTNLKTTSTSQTVKQVSWTNPTGNYTGLKVYYRLFSASTYTLYTTITNKSTTTCSISGLTAGTEYYFMIESYLDGVSNVGTSSQSSYSAKTAPNAVTNLQFSSRTTNSLTVTWTKPEGNYDSYKVYYKKESDSSYSSYVTVSKDATSCKITGLTCGTQYNVYVQTVYSSFSYNCSAENYEMVTSPGVPTNVSASIDSSNGLVKVTWSAPAGKENYYKVFYATSATASTWYSGSWVTGHNNNSYYIPESALTNGTTYYFKVYSNYDNDGVDLYSDYSAVSAGLKYNPPAPDAITDSNFSIYTDDAMGRIGLKWKTPSTKISKTVIYVNGSYIAEVASTDTNTYQYQWITIPNYKRSTSSYIYLKTWRAGVYSTATKSLYTNTNGLLKINGSYYTYSQLVDTVTSDLTLNMQVNYNLNGAFPKNRAVRLSPYSMGAYEVTQNLYYAVMGSNPSTLNINNSGDYPVNNVNWYQAIAFCNKLSVLQGLDPCYTISGYTNDDWKTITHSQVPTTNNSTWNAATMNFKANGYHLPTEAQWEFAARGGQNQPSGKNSSGTFYFWTQYAGHNDRDQVAWWSGNSNSTTHPVYSQPNTSTVTDFYVNVNPGSNSYLYNMSGNVRELVNDWYYIVSTGGSSTSQPYYNPYCGYNTSSSSLPTSITSSTAYTTLSRANASVLTRGGSYSNDAYCAVDNRAQTQSSYTQDSHTGFRLCRNVIYAYDSSN